MCHHPSLPYIDKVGHHYLWKGVGGGQIFLGAIDVDGTSRLLIVDIFLDYLCFYFVSQKMVHRTQLIANETFDMQGLSTTL